MSQRSKHNCYNLLLIMIINCLLLNFGYTKADTGLDKKVGVIYLDSKDNLLLDIQNSHLEQGTRIIILTFPYKSVCCYAEVIKELTDESETIRQIIFDDGESSKYILKLVNKNDEISFGFGIIDSQGIFSSESNELMVDFNKDGINDTFRGCTSHEGVHLSIWSGLPLKSSRLWHAYLYLGYDVEPSCVGEDFN